MNRKTIDVNNLCKITIETTENGILISHIDSKDKIEYCYRIFDDEIVMLLNLYERLIQNDEKSCYIINDFVRKILNDTRATDYAEEFRILQ